MATDTEKIIVQVVVKGQGQLDNLEKKTKTTTLGFNKLTAGILGAAAAFRQINKVISSGIRTFRDFEFQMAKTKAVTNASDAEFKKLDLSAQKLGRSTFFTAQQVAELQTNYGKLGFTTQQILDAQEATLNLAVATDSDLGRAAIVAGAAVKGFGLDVSETTRVVDVMTAAFASSPLDIEKWQTSMTKVAPIAASANISIEATAAIMGVLADAGHEASIAGTSLRNIFLKMMNPTSDLAQQIGFTVHSADDLIIALHKLNDAQLDNERIGEIVDVRQQAIFRTMLKGVQTIEDSTNAYIAAGGSAKRMADIIGDTFEGDMKRLTSASQGLAIVLVSKLGNSLRRVVKRITDFINLMTKNSETVSTAISVTIDLVKWIGLYRIGVFAATKATIAWRGAVALLNGSLKITKGALARTGVGLLAVGLGELAMQYLFAADSAEELGDASDDLNKSIIKQLELSAEALQSQLNIGKKTKKQIADEEEQEKQKRFQKEQKQLENHHIEEISKLKERYKNGLDTKEEFDEKSFTKEQLHLANMLGLYERYGKNTAEINAQILDNELDRIETTAKKENKLRKEQIDDIDDLGDALVQLAGENEKLNKVREVGVAITQAAAAAESVLRIQEILSEITKGKLTLATLLGTKAKVANTAVTTAETVATGANTVATTANTVVETASIVPKVASGAASQTKLPFPLNIIAVLATLAVLSKIMKSFGDGGVIDTFANGGMVHGKSHAQGGEKFAVGGRVVELEGGEAVINKRSTSMFRNQLSAMNAAGGGVKFADGGLMNMPSFAQSQFNATSQAGMMGAIGQGGKVVVVESDISTAQNTVSVIEAEATF